MINVALISCVSKKCPNRTVAEKMYISPLFKKSLTYVKDIIKPDKIHILSAKYGLLNLNDEIDPYNETLNEKTKEEKKKWANDIIFQLKSKYNVNDDRFIFLAGKNYYKYLINNLPNKTILMENLSIGKRLHWLKEKTNEQL